MGMFGSLLGSVTGSTARDAGKGMAKAAQQGMDQQTAIYNQSRKDMMPWLTSGTAANNRLSVLLGLSPTTTVGENKFDAASYLANNPDVAADPYYSSRPEAHYQKFGQYEGRKGAFTGQTTVDNTTDPAYGSLTKAFDMNDYVEDPGYQFRLAEGEKGINRGLASRGNYFSGAAMKALTGYNSDQASQEYGNAYNRYNTDQNNLYSRLAGVSGSGQQQAGALGSLGQNYGNSIADLLGTQASAYWNGQIGAGNILKDSAYRAASAAAGVPSGGSGFQGFGPSGSSKGVTWDKPGRY